MLSILYCCCPNIVDGQCREIYKLHQLLENEELKANLEHLKLPLNGLNDVLVLQQQNYYRTNNPNRTPATQTTPDNDTNLFLVQTQLLTQHRIDNSGVAMATKGGTDEHYHCR